MSKIYTDLNTVLTPYATAIKKNASDITSLNGSLDALYDDEGTSGLEYSWVVGGLKYENGTEQNDITSRLRSGFIDVKKGDEILCSADYNAMCVYAYDSSKVYNQQNTMGAWNSNSYVCQFDGYVRLLVREDRGTFDPIPDSAFDTLKGYIIIVRKSLRAVTETLNVIFGFEKGGTEYDWELGSFSGNGTASATTNSRIRTIDFIPCLKGNIVKCSASYGAMVVYAYDDAQNPIIAKSQPTWTNENYVVSHNGYIKIGLRKEDNSNISTSEFETLESYVTYFIEGEFTTDKDLTEDGKPADAKATGDALSVNDRVYRFNKQIGLYNPYKEKGDMKLKGQMHCHTTNSDGSYSAVTLVGKYSEAGYDFITITDHNVITAEPSGNSLIWLGNSYEDTTNVAEKQHCNIYNADAVYGRTSMYQTTNTPETLVNHFVKGGNSVICYNHPEYPTVYASDETLENLPKGFSFVEVWNGTIQCTLGTVATTGDLPLTARFYDMYFVTAENSNYINTSHDRNAPNWVVASSSSYPEGNLDRGFYKMLDAGHKVFCMAVDDCHFDSCFDYGWIIAFANSRSKRSVWESLLSGAFYASSGVSYTDVSCVDGVLSVTVDAVEGETYTTTFYGKENAVLATVTGTTASYEITGTEDYVRAVTVSSKNLQTKAWTQPVWIRQVKGQYEF